MNAEAASMKVPEDLKPLYGLVRKYLTRDLLNAEWYDAAEERERTGEVVPPTFGHCASAAGAFWELAGGSDAGWRFRRLPKRLWDEGPHYFVEHLPSKTVIDPTADQFSVEVPYPKAEGGAPPTRGGPINKTARELAERVLSDPTSKAAIEAAQQWASEQSPASDVVASEAKTIVRATVQYREHPDHTTFENIPPAAHAGILAFLGARHAEPLDVWDDAFSISYNDAPAVLQHLQSSGIQIDRLPAVHADSALALFVRPDTVVTAAAKSDKPQGQREISKVIQRFLKDIKAHDIRVRRMGHVTYTWLHPMEIEPGDTHSDLRWEIRQSGSQILMGVFDIKPFYRVITGPFDVKKFKDTRNQIIKDMDTDADGK